MLPVESSETTLLITEIFHSIQGESTFAGLPCSFIRLARCHLRCTWCDTTYSFTGGDRRTIGQILAEVEAADLPICEVTGGEPLLQPAVYPLMEALVSRGRPVLLETSGAISVADVPPQVHRIVDMKPPGSGEQDKNYLPNLDLLGANDELKFVVLDRGDYEWARDLLRDHDVANRVAAVIFSPVHGDLDPAELSAWLIEDRLRVRVGLQLHKMIWPGVERGV